MQEEVNHRTQSQAVADAGDRQSLVAQRWKAIFQPCRSWANSQKDWSQAGSQMGCQMQVGHTQKALMKQKQVNQLAEKQAEQEEQKVAT